MLKQIINILIIALISINTYSQENETSFLFKEGEDYMKANNYEMAFEKYSKVIEKDTNNFASYYNLASIWLYYKNKPDSALIMYSKALEFKKDTLLTELLNGRGACNLMMDNGVLAKKDFLKVIEIDSNNFEGYINLGDVETFFRNFDKSFYYYEKALKINPQNPITYISRGFAFYLSGNNKEACKDWEKAIELGDTSVMNDYINKYCKK